MLTIPKRSLDQFTYLACDRPEVEHALCHELALGQSNVVLGCTAPTVLSDLIETGVRSYEATVNIRHLRLKL